MPKIYSYILRHDDGAAPNPFWGICTLTICKPAIRRTAQVGDWVIGTGSKNTQLENGVEDFSNHLVYAMRVTDKMSLKDYDNFCKTSLKNKLPNCESPDWRQRMGDCIYDYSKGDMPAIRTGVHNEGNRNRDLGGHNALLSNEFFYFGDKPQVIPDRFKVVIKQNQGHKKIELRPLIEDFIVWLEREFEYNKIYGEPQLKHKFDKSITKEILSQCAKSHHEADEEDAEESIC